MVCHSALISSFIQTYSTVGCQVLTIIPVLNPATICAALCAVVAMWGHWHAKSRIEWNTGHNDAYILVQQLDPERIFYSGSIWDFHFSGKANAFSIASDGIDVLSGASGRDILVATRLGACEAKSLATDKPATN